MRKILASLFWTMVLMGAALAQGVTIKLEGGHGFVNFKDTGIVLLERDAPPSDVFFSDLERGMKRGPGSSFVRGELDYDFALPSGKLLRLGGIWSDLQGSHHEETPVYFWVDTQVAYTEDGSGQVSMGRIGTCPLVDGQSQPCATYIGSLDRGYHEFAPQVLLGQAQGERTNWLGLQGFSGRLDETTAGTVESRFAPISMMTEVGGNATGLMLVWQQERLLPSGARLTLGLGLGGYHMKATSLSYREGARNPNATQRGSFNGARAQLSAGLEYPLSKRLSIGGTIRADLWSAQPRVDMDLPITECVDRLVCHQYLPDGKDFGLTHDPFSSVSVALSLTLRL